MNIQRLLLLVCVLLLFAVGLVMIFNTSSAEILDHSLNKSTHEALVKQILYAILGTVVAIDVYFVGFQNILRLSGLLLAVFSFLLLLTLIPGVGLSVNGSRRWLGIAGYTIQPSEFVKFILPLFCIYQIERQGGQIKELKTFLKLTAVIAIPIVLVFIEPNNGTAAFLLLTLVMLFILIGIPSRYWVLPLLVVVLIGGVVAVNLPYVSGRLKVYFNPELDIRGRGHQPHQAKIAAGSGGLFGKGPGKSLQKLSYLPEAQNDYIAAIYAEEFGFLGMLALILLYMLIAYLGFHIASQSPSLSGFYLAGSITFLICFQAFLNLAVVSGLLPSTGLNLPFFSQGGSSLMANIIGLGMLLDIGEERMRDGMDGMDGIIG